VKRFLRELEARLATLTPGERKELADSYLALIRGVTASTKVIGGLFKPSKMAALGLLSALTGAMGPGGGDRLKADLQAMAPTIGPNVTTLVSAL
jgi:hypothetical protein